MKLNKEQINAIAYEFYSKLEEENRKLNEKLIKEQQEKFRPTYNKGIKLLEKNDWLESIDILDQKIKISLSRGESFEDYLDNWNVRQVINHKSLTVSMKDIANAIILATIEANNLDEVMEVLKNKFK
jgi:acetone carboxylase gamma subunit